MSEQRVVRAIRLEADPALRQAFLRMLADYDANDQANGEWYGQGREDFEAYVRRLEDDERGIDLAPGYVPCSHRWLIDDAGEIVGVVRVRHNLDSPFLAEVGGHIGYDVPPSMRGRRYAIDCLRAGLAEAKRLGIERVMVTADSHNAPSWRTIERCGGVMEEEWMSSHYGCLVRRYWIENF